MFELKIGIITFNEMLKALYGTNRDTILNQHISPKTWVNQLITQKPTSTLPRIPRRATINYVKHTGCPKSPLITLNLDNLKRGPISKSIHI